MAIIIDNECLDVGTWVKKEVEFYSVCGSTIFPIRSSETGDLTGEFQSMYRVVGSDKSYSVLIPVVDCQAEQR
jgi:hypothetical protein